jgi:integrase
MASLLYGAGLRLRECLKLRVKDLDFDYQQITVRDAKGAKDRVTMLPAGLREPLRTHLVRVKALHEQDLAEGFGAVEMPFALERKYPNAAREWGWQYVFPSRHRSADPRSGAIRRHHVFDSVLPRAISQARGTPTSPSRSDRTRCAILSRRTCWRRGTTSARCRSCWATST